MSIIKNICYNQDNGRLILSDSENNHYLCDIYGNEKTKFLPNITGYASFHSRNNMIFKNNSYNNIKGDSEIQKNSFTNYFPITYKFKGYSKFPRPIVPPFSNISKIDFSKKKQNKLIQILKKYYSSNKVKEYFKINDKNNNLNYLTCDLNTYDLKKKDGIKLMKIVNESINFYKKKNETFVNNDEIHIINALKHFKKMLNENKDMKIINGNTIEKPNKEIKEKYDLINKLINKNAFKKKINKSSINIFREKFNHKNNTSLNFFNHSFQNKIKSNSFIKFKTINKDIENNDNINFNTLKIEIDNKNNDKEKNLFNITKECFYSTKGTINKFDISEKNKNDIKNEISILSIRSKNEIKYEKENNKKIKGNDFYLKKYNEELKYITGYKKIIPKSKPIFQKFNNLNLKTNGDLFIENINLLQKTNSIAFEIQKEQEMFDFKMLQKRKNEDKINYMNALKTSQKIEKEQLKALKRYNSMV